MPAAKKTGAADPVASQAITVRVRPYQVVRLDGLTYIPGRKLAVTPEQLERLGDRVEPVRTPEQPAEAE
jgi:hypothetical protein